jgi:hypothetical protein
MAASFDKDGNVTSYSWQQIAGPLVNLSNVHSSRPTFTTPSVTKGTPLGFKLTVTDNDNGISSASTSMVVKNVNISPIASTGTNQTVNDNSTSPIILDGTKSLDPDGTIKSYHWAEISSSPIVQLIGANTSKLALMCRILQKMQHLHSGLLLQIMMELIVLHVQMYW